MYLQIHDRPLVKLGANAPRRSGERSPDAVTCDPESPKASADHKRHQNVGSPSKEFEEICVHIDQALPADSGDPAEYRLGFL